MLVSFVVSVVSLSFSAFFSASETALFSIPKEQLSALFQGGRRDQKIGELMKQGDLLLILILLGNNFVNILAISALGKIFAELTDESLFLTFFATTATLLVFGEVLPKNIALGRSRAISQFSAPIFLFLVAALHPLVDFFRRTNLAILRLNYNFLLRSPGPFITVEEYSGAVREAIKHQKLSSSAGETINSYLQLAEIPLSHIAIHRHSLKCFSDSKERATLSTTEIGLLYDASGDVVQQVFYCDARGQNCSVDAQWYPLSRSIGDLHEYFLEHGTDVVLLFDEYGAHYGAATRWALYRLWKTLNSPQEQNQGNIHLLGSMSVIECRHWLPEQMREKYPEMQTVNGLVCAWLESIPTSGTIFTVESCIFTVEESSATKIETIFIQKDGFCDDI